MADDYTIHIKASVSGDDGGNNVPPQSDAVDEAAMRAKLLEDILRPVSYSTEPSEPVQKRGRGRPKLPEDQKKQKEEKDPKREKTAIEDIIEKLKSFVSIFDGHNGRFTKALNGVQRGVAGWQDTVHQANLSAQKQAKATTSAGQAAQQQAKTTATTTAAAGNFTKVISQVAAKIGPVGIALAAVAASAISLVVAFKAVNRALQGMLETVGNFSAAVAQARAREQAAIIQRQIRAGSQIGGEVGSLQSSMTEVNNTLNKIWTNFYDLIYPFLKVALQVINQILKVINSYLEILVGLHSLIERGTESLLQILTHIPVLGKAAKAALDWMKQDDINKAEANSLNAQIEEIFSAKSLGLDQDKKKKRIESRFL